MHVTYYPCLGTITYYIFPIWWIYQDYNGTESPSTCYWLVPGTQTED